MVKDKGAPAQESHTGTRLVSPDTGCQKKKKRHLWSRASEHKFEYIRDIIRSTDAMETGTAPGKPLKYTVRGPGQGPTLYTYISIKIHSNQNHSGESP